MAYGFNDDKSKVTLANVATSGKYSNLLEKPKIQTVATSFNYNENGKYNLSTYSNIMFIGIAMYDTDRMIHYPGTSIVFPTGINTQCASGVVSLFNALPRFCTYTANLSAAGILTITEAFSKEVNGTIDAAKLRPFELYVQTNTL